MFKKAIVTGLAVASLFGYSTLMYAQDYMQKRDTLINQGYQDMYNRTYSPSGKKWVPPTPGDQQGVGQPNQRETQQERCARLHNCDTSMRWCRQYRQMVGCSEY